MGSGRGRNAGEEVQGSTLPISAAQPPASSQSLYSAVAAPAWIASTTSYSFLFLLSCPHISLTWQKMCHFWYLGEVQKIMKKLDISNNTKTFIKWHLPPANYE